MKLNEYVTEKRLGLILVLLGLFTLVPAHLQVRERSVEVLSDISVLVIEDLNAGLLTTYSTGLIIITSGLTLVLSDLFRSRMRNG